MMNLVNTAFAAVVVSAIALPAIAAERRPNDPQTPGVEGTAAKDSGPSKILSLEGAQAAQVGRARVALVYDAFGERILRSKGVRSVRKPGSQTGLYCIRTTLTTRQTRNLVPSVTVEFSNSINDRNQAYFAYYRQNGCRSDEIGVQTRRIADNGRMTNTDFVGWALVAN